jgi:pantoate kinase
MNIVFGQPEVRQAVPRRLSTGQTIELTKQDEKMLRAAYDYMQGFCKRSQLEKFVETKRTQVRVTQ